jgi:hypothetical protein
MENAISLDSLDNKKLLWNLLHENGIFTGIDNDKFDAVKNIFENKLVEIKNTSTDIVDLTILNKKAIGTLVNEINNFKKNLHNTNQVKIPKENYKKEDIQKERKDEFNSELLKHQTNFNENITGSKPSNINFSSDLDTPLGSDMDIMIASTIANRERELEQLTTYKNVDTAKEWINNDNTQASSSVNLKIGDSANLQDVKIVKKEKHVSFAEDNNVEISTENFLNKLKPKKDNITVSVEETSQNGFDIKREIGEIKENQRKILDMLQNILSNSSQSN